MKSFLKYTSASLLALFLFTIVSSIIMLVSFAGLMARDGMTAPVKKNTILRINLNGTLPELSEDNPLSSLTGNGEEGLPGLSTLTEAIAKATENEFVKGIYIENAALSGTPATIQELRQALIKFKKSGKFIIS